VDAFDLSAAVRSDPGGDAGATYQRIRLNTAGTPTFLVMRVEAELDGVDTTFAVALEAYGPPAQAWAGWLQYEVEEGGVGGLVGWQEHEGELAGADIPEPILGILFPHSTLRPFAVEPPDTGPAPVNAAFGELPADKEPPGTALEQSEFTVQLMVRDLLDGRVQGVCVVRTAGRAWEVWNPVDFDRLDASLDDLIRAVANRPDDTADGIAFVMMALFENGERGVQLVAERGDERMERRLIVDHDGELSDQCRTVPIADEERWLGIPPSREIELFGDTQGEA